VGIFRKDYIRCDFCEEGKLLEDNALTIAAYFREDDEVKYFYPDLDHIPKPHSCFLCDNCAKKLMDLLAQTILPF
jgi:hypothetical protein